MNPPYGEDSKGSNKFLHLDFTTKCLSLCDIVVSVMPHKIITTQNTDKFDKYKKIFDKSIISIEEIDGKKFFKGEISTYELGIFTFDKNNKVLYTIFMLYLLVCIFYKRRKEGKQHEKSTEESYGIGSGSSIDDRYSCYIYRSSTEPDNR